MCKQEGISNIKNLHFQKLDAVIESVFNDDIDEFQRLTCAPYFQWSNYPVSETEIRMNLLHFSAVVGSVLIFMFLIINDCYYYDSVKNFAISGGNSEIIHILEQKGLEYDYKCPKIVLFIISTMYMIG